MIQDDSNRYLMCGILFFRIISKDETVKQRALQIYQSIKQSVSSRGPESHNSVECETSGVYCTFHRLATYGDLNEMNMMPIQRDGWMMMCNGDIYNYRDLWQTVEDTPKTSNDCEILIPLVDTESFPSQLRGVFASVLWNKQTQQLVIIRDPYGVRPLFRVQYSDEFELYMSDLRVLQNIIHPGMDSNELEVEEIFPGSLQRLRITPYEPTRRFVNKKWFNVSSIPSDEQEGEVTQEVLDAYAMKAHDALLDAVKVRICGANRPFGCLVSGGLDSSLVAGMVFAHLPLHLPMYTYSIGMKGATDETHAKAVADHLGTQHSHIEVTKEQMLGAIREVIGAIGSYDTTTVRASVGNYLICKEIRKQNKSIYLFNGDGADELMGGYLYFHNAPDATSFDSECRRLLSDIHSFDVLRSDRSIGGNGLAPRTPYLDIEFTKKYLSIPKEVRFVAQKRCEKYLIRRGCERHHYIPREVLWRTKEAMSDGVSSVEDSWHTILLKFAESQLPEPLESYVEVKLEHNTPTTKEQVLYRRIYREIFGMVADTTVPYFWLPRFVSGDNVDASARTLDVYKQKQSEIKNVTMVDSKEHILNHCPFG